MSLILAVEPDRRQAKELSTLVRRHLKAELVIADSGTAALEALEDRVPDLILTPALLPPRDEAVLTGWLRELGDAASHVQTLAIPILARADARSRDNASIFNRRRDQQEPSSPGCDPAIFAAQVKVYLERADSERPAAQAARPARTPEPPAIATAGKDDEAIEIEFDENLSLEDLVIEGPSFDRKPVESPPPAPAPREAAVTTPFPAVRPQKAASPAPPVDPAMLRAWEAELGIETASGVAGPLWRAIDDRRQGDSGTSSAAKHEDAEWSAFDPAQPWMVALLRRLDEVASGQATR